MAAAQLERLVRGISQRVLEPDSDEVLLSRFCQQHDGGSFSELVRRHGPTVLGVCRRVLGDHHAAEDAFQAAFLVLARRAGDVSPPGAVGAWLYGVAYRTALKARGRAFRRRAVEQEYVVRWLENPEAGADRAPEVVDPDLLAAIDEHLSALPPRYRVPLVLCGVQGLGKAEAAEQLGIPEGTVSSRLARGRAMLRDRLTRHGFAIPATALATTLLPHSLQAGVPIELASTTASAGPGFAAGSSAGVATEVLALTHEVLRSMTLIKWQLLSVLTVLGLTFGGFAGTFTFADVKPAKPAPVTVQKPAERDKPRKPGSEEKPKPSPEKPKKPGSELVDGHRLTGHVAKVDAAANTITLATKNQKGAGEQVITVAVDARIRIEDKPAKLADIPIDSTASVFIPNDSKEAAAVMVHGPRLTGIVAKIEGDTIAIGPKGVDSKETRSITILPDTHFQVDGKKGSIKDLKAGMPIGVQLSLDGKAAVVMKLVRDADKPVKPGAKVDGEKPVKPGAKVDGEKPGKTGTKPAGDKPRKSETKPAGEKPRRRVRKMTV